MQRSAIIVIAERHREVVVERNASSRPALHRRAAPLLKSEKFAEALPLLRQAGLRENDVQIDDPPSAMSSHLAAG